MISFKTRDCSLHCLPKYRISFRCSCLWQTVPRLVGLSFLSVGEISIKKYLSVRRKGFPSKLDLPPLRSTNGFAFTPYFSTICSTNFVRKFNASNLPPFLQNTPREFHVETTWKRPFPRRFNVESTWCVCNDVGIEWRYVYKMHKMFLVPLLYLFVLSRIGSGHLVPSVNAAHHVVLYMNDSW